MHFQRFMFLHYFLSTVLRAVVPSCISFLGGNLLYVNRSLLVQLSTMSGTNQHLDVLLREPVCLVKFKEWSD